MLAYFFLYLTSAITTDTIAIAEPRAAPYACEIKLYTSQKGALARPNLRMVCSSLHQSPPVWKRAPARGSSSIQSFCITAEARPITAIASILTTVSGFLYRAKGLSFFFAAKNEDTVDIKSITAPENAPSNRYCVTYRALEMQVGWRV